MGTIDIKLKPEVINTAYRQYLMQYSQRYEIYYGGAGSGKSHFIGQKILVKALNQKRKVLIARKVAATLRDSCFQLVLDILTKWKMSAYCVVNLSTLTITLPSGSKLLFRGLDDVEKLKSIQRITDIWFEEATEGTQEDFLQLDLRLRAKVENSQFFLSFNPTSKASWVYTKWFAPDAPQQQDTFILKTTYRNNAFLPDAYIKTLEAMRDSNPTYYHIYAEGEFSSLDKLIYTNWTVQPFDWRQVPGLLCCGQDFGYTNDPSALIASKIDEASKTIYVWLEVYRAGMFNNEIADIIKYHGLQKEIWIGDSAEAKSIDELRLKYGISRIKAAVKGQGSVNAGIAALQGYRFIVHPLCVNTITELQNYAWTKDKQTGEYINTPIDKYNHALDALRYSLQVLDNLQRLQTIPKKLLGL